MIERIEYINKLEQSITYGISINEYNFENIKVNNFICDTTLLLRKRFIHNNSKQYLNNENE